MYYIENFSFGTKICPVKTNFWTIDAESDEMKIPSIMIFAGVILDFVTKIRYTESVKQKETHITLLLQLCSLVWW